MIPRIIHYCWFGGSPLPSEYKIYIDEWKILHPEWEVRRWDENNFPVESSYMENALKGSNWANASNYARLKVINDYGGIYLDTDVKLLQPLDCLRDYPCFLGFEEGEQHNNTFWVNNAVFGAIPNHPFSQKCLDKIVRDFDGNERPNESSPKLATKVLIEDYQLTNYGRQLLADDIFLFEKEVFYPIPWNLVKNTLNYKDYTSPNTIGVHMWGRTWFTREMMLEMIDDLQYWSRNLENESTNNKALINKLTEERDFLKKEVGEKESEIRSLHEKNENLDKLLFDRTFISDESQAKSQNYMNGKFFDLETTLKNHHQESIEFLVKSNDQLSQIYSLIDQSQNQIQQLQSITKLQQDTINNLSVEKRELLHSYHSEIAERKKAESEWAEQKRALEAKVIQSEALAEKLLGDVSSYEEAVKALQKKYEQKSILETIKAKIKI